MPWMESLKKKGKRVDARNGASPFPPEPVSQHRSSSMGRVPLSQDPRTGISHFKTKARTGSESQSLRATNHEPTQKAKRDSNVRIKQR